MKYKALLFDFDGTVADTYDLCVESFRLTLLEALGKELSRAEITAHFGYNEEGVLRRFLGEERARETMPLLLTHYRTLMQQRNAAPFPGVRELLMQSRKQGYRIALATGKSKATTDISLDCYAWGDLFECVTTGSPLTQSKTGTMKQALTLLNVSPEEALYIGDAPSDVTSARGVPMRIAGAGWAASTDISLLKKAEPDYLFASIAELSQFLSGDAQ
ncbi:MAG: HAD hydrolase-like protein [Victivallaceae bacterium]|nr:HAD hydrolase-like protein [Victivallaceae bacterium]